MLSSVKKALEILQVFTTDKPELSLTEISKRLITHKSSTSRILRTLASEGFVEKNPITKKYRLGLKIIQLANRALGRFEVRDHAAPFMQNLADRVEETIHLAILDNNEIVYLEKKSGGSQVLTVASSIGAKSPAHASAMGKVLLAGLPQEKLNQVIAHRVLEKFTPQTITDQSQLAAELKTVKKQGYATDYEERFLGIRCVGAPIYGADGNIIAAISATVPKQRMGAERMNKIRKEVIETARLITEQISSHRLGD